MIEIHYLVFVFITVGSHLAGYITSALLAAGRTADIEQQNRFYQEMLLIKDREIRDLEEVINKLKRDKIVNN